MPISPIPQVQNLNILDPQKMAPAAVAEMKAAGGIGKKYAYNEIYGITRNSHKH
jgi:hypothetical protein